MKKIIIALLLILASSYVVAQETLVNEQPPTPIEAANWFESVYWGFLEIIGIETPNEEQYREWKERVESRINNQNYNISEVKLVLAEKKAVRQVVVSVPIYETKLVDVPQYYWDGTKNVSNGTTKVEQTTYKGTEEQTINETYVVENWQELITQHETYVVPKDRACIEQQDNILCVSVPHCLGHYTLTNILAYVNPGCENELIPKNALNTIQQIATKPHVYTPPLMPTKKEILASKDPTLIDKVLPKALADEAKTTQVAP